jgi:hypothetical protein
LSYELKHTRATFKILKIKLMARALPMRQDDFPNFTTPKMMMSTPRDNFQLNHRVVNCGKSQICKPGSPYQVVES